MEYREVNSIALYDSNILIEVSGYQHPFHEFGEGDSVRISVSDLLKISTKLGVDVWESDYDEDPKLFYKETNRYLYERDFKITKILANLDSDVLNIKVSHVYKEEEEYTNEFSYSGKFSINWK